MHPPTNSRPLVGRSREQTILRGLLQRTQQSQGQVAFIVGEAGIGKTRLLTDIIGLAETDRMLVLRGECVDQDQNLPYAPIIDGLRTYFSGSTSEEIRRIIDPYQGEVIKLLPELALRITEAPRPALLEPEAEKRRLFEVLVQIYQRLATSGLLLISEDIHWSDVNSVEFFYTLTRRISKLPVMVVLTSRLTAPDSEVSKLQLYLDRAENAQSIPLNPLTDSEIEDLIRAVLHTAEALHPLFLERLIPLVQGNPLYTEQIMYTLLQNRQISLVNSTWMFTSSTSEVVIPISLKQTIQQLLEQLSTPAKQVLQFAAVIGRQFDLNVLRRLKSFEHTLLTGVMKELMTWRFLEEVSRDRFAFRHALLRQTIYDDLLIRERQELHRSLLHILEDYDAIQSDTYAVELSHHAYLAEAWESARQYGFQAGQHALSLHSPRAAVDHFSHAIEAANQLSEQATWELLMQRGGAYDSLGEFHLALQDYEAALQVAKDTGDQKAEWQTLMAVALLWSSRDYQRAGDYCNRALQLAQSMEEPAMIGHSLNRLGNWYLNTGHPADALRYHEQAMVVFEDLDDMAGKAETLDLLGMTSGQMMRSDAAQDYYRLAVAIFRQLDDRKALASILANLANWTFDMVLAEEAVQIARQIGWYSGETYACVSLGYMHSWSGRFNESLAYLQHGLELARAIDHTQWLTLAHVYSAFAYRDILELTRAVDHVRKGIALADEVGSQWFKDMGNGLLATLLIEQEQLAEAAEVLARQPVPKSPAMQHTILILAQVDLAVAQGQAEAALASSEQVYGLVTTAGDSNSMGALSVGFYLVAQARTLMLLGRENDARAALGKVRSLCTRWNFLPILWRVEVLLGQTLLADDRAAAQDCFQRARDCIDQLADYVPSATQQRFRQRAEKIITAAEKPQLSTAARHQLTRRELDVAREIALGKTNQQIADDLHITVKTVETHITRALSKLDLTSRTQIALWAVENQLAPPEE